MSIRPPRVLSPRRRVLDDAISGKRAYHGSLPSRDPAIEDRDPGEDALITARPFVHTRETG